MIISILSKQLSNLMKEDGPSTPGFLARSSISFTFFLTSPHHHHHHPQHISLSQSCWHAQDLYHIPTPLLYSLLLILNALGSYSSYVGQALNFSISVRYINPPTVWLRPPPPQPIHRRPPVLPSICSKYPTCNMSEGRTH